MIGSFVLNLMNMTQGDSRPIKVMQLALSLTIGGTEKLVYDIVRRVDKQTVAPIICCLDEFGHFGERLQAEGFQVYTLSRTPGIDWQMIPKLAHIIEQEQVDVIHAQQYSPFFYAVLSVLYYRIALRKPAPKLLYTEHGIFYPYRRKFKHVLLNPILCQFADEIVAISKSLKANMVKYENFPERRIEVVYNGIELDRFAHVSVDSAAKRASLGLPPQAQVIGIVARLNQVKNHPMLLRAFKRIMAQQPDAYLLIIGDGPEEAKLKALAESLQVTDRAWFLGPRSDVAELLQILDVYALSSFSEGTSVSILEAMASGLPVVTTRVGGNPEVVREPETAFLVESDNDEQMAAKLLELLRDPALRGKMGQAGKARAYAEFAQEKMVSAYTAMYQKLAAPCRPQKK